MEEVHSWLQTIGLSKHALLFEQNEIGFDVVPDLTAADLKELGIPLGDRLRLLKAIAALGQKKQEPQPSTKTEAATAERRQVTIVFCDVVGSTKLANRLDPEDLAGLLAAYQAHCKRIVERWGGHVAEFLGDGAVIWFGWPKAREHDGERAVQAALELVAACATIAVGDGTHLQARAGIATGRVMVGEIKSDALHQRDGIVGETPNLAARLQGIAPPGAVAISAQTRQLIGDRFELVSLGEHSLKGFSESVTVWQVQEARSLNRFQARVGEQFSPLVGRHAEVAALLDGWRRARRGRVCSMLVLGEAGIGKSRLLQELLERTALEHGRSPAVAERALIRLQGSPYHSNTALQPFLGWLRDQANLHGELGNDSQLDRLDQLAMQLGEDPAQATPLLAVQLSIPIAGRYPPLSAGLQRQRQLTIELLTKLLLQSAHDRPLLLVVEDLHWVDPTTMELLRHVVASDAALPCLVVLTSRTTLDLPAERIATVALARLESHATTDLVATLTDGKPLPERVLASIVASADGVPLFIEELTRTLIESGRLRDHGDHYEQVGRGASLDVPSTLQDLLVARLDSLAHGKTTARVASTLGREFSIDLLAAVAGCSDEKLQADIEYLCESGILQCESTCDLDRAYSFRHALLREAAYQSQLKIRRREVHGKVAAVLDSQGPAAANAEPEVVAHHFAEAGQPLPASRYLLRAGQGALRASAVFEATTHFSKGVELLRALPEELQRDRTELRLQALLGTTFMHAKSWGAAEVEVAYLAAGRLAQAAETTAEQAWVLWGIWVFYHVRGRINDGFESAARIQALAARSGDADAALVVDMVMSQNNFYGGRPKQAVENCTSFFARYEPERARELTAAYSTNLELVCVVHRGFAMWVMGQTAGARQSLAEVDALCERLQHPYSRSWAMTWSAVLDIFLDDTTRAQQKIAAGKELAAEYGYAYVQTMADVLRAYLDGLRGDASSIARLAEGIADFGETGAEIVLPFFQTLRAEILIQHGRAADALPLLRDARQRIKALGERWQEPEVYRMEASALRAIAAAPEDIERCYQSACRRALEAGLHAWHLRAADDYSQYLQQSGRRDEASDVIATARNAASDS